VVGKTERRSVEPVREHTRPLTRPPGKARPR
jgi:hypothetical protein